LQVHQASGSRFQGHVVSLGGALVRNDACVRLEEEGADCALNGLYLLAGSQHLDNHTLIEHAAAHGTSRELYKGVLDGQARAVFDGPIHVLPGAQKTDAQVYNRNLLLSEQGLVNTKPEFKINANDVQCKHGATIGQLSADNLFYLRSRGIGQDQAKALLIFAFASEMIERLPFAPVREALSRVLTRRFLGACDD
jgi:Fe-S cluster assembly protein SufD